MKCLEKDRSRRYETANGFAADLRRHLENQPVVARPPGAGYLLSRFVRRHKIGFAAGAAVSIALLTGLAAVTWGLVTESAARSALEAEVTKTKTANDENKKNLHLASMADLASAIKALDEDAEATRKGQHAAEFAGKSPWHEGVVLLTRSLERDPQNSVAALQLYETLRSRQAEKRDWPRHTLKYDGSASFSPDGTRIVTVSEDKTTRVWDVATGQTIGQPMGHEDPVLSASFSPDGTKVVTTSDDNAARVWDAATGQAIGERMRHERTVSSASFSPDGTKVVTASADQTARIWDAATGQPIGEPMRHGAQVTDASFSPDGTQVITAGYDNTVRVWNAATGQVIGEPMRHEGWVGYPDSASFSPDGARVVTAGVDACARVWDAATGQAIGQPMRHEYPDVISAGFSPDGSRILTAGDPTRVWDAATGQPIGEPMGHEEAVNSASFSLDGTKVVTASADQTARVWDAATGQAIGEPLYHQSRVTSASFSPDGTRVVTTSADQTARVWDAATGQALGETMHHKRVMSARFSPDGARIVTVSYSSTRIWNVLTKIESDTARVSLSLQTPLSSWNVLTKVESDATGAITPDILAWARNVSGLRFSEDGELHPIPDAERIAAITTTLLPAGPWADLARWINTPVPQRTVNPKSKSTLRQIAERERDFDGSGTVGRLESALRYDATVPLARLFLAAAMEKADAARDAKYREAILLPRAAQLRRYDLDALARETGRMKNEELAALWVRAANHLLELPAETKTGVGPKVTTAREEAEKAARKALELVPGMPAAEEVLKKF